MRSSKRVQLTLMAISSILLFALTALWLNSSYSSKKDSLRQTATLQLRSAIFDLEDSLRQHNLIRRNKLRNQVDQEDTVRTHLFQGPDGRRAAIRVKRENRNPQVFQGALSLHLQLSRQDALPLDLVADSSVIDLIIPALQIRLDDVKDSKWGVVVVPAKEDYGSPPPLQTRTYRDLFGEFELTGIIENSSIVLWRQLVPELLMCFLLISCTITAFVVTYRHSEHQRRLVILKDNLISNISHELQTPISTVKVALEAIAAKSHETNTINHEYLDISMQEINRLAYLVDQILLDSTGHGTDRFESVNLRELIEEVMQVMAVQFNNKDAQVSFDHLAGEATIQGDPDKIRTALTNLLDNALKYSPDAPKIDIQLKKSARQVSIHVSDNGIGIASKFQGKVFERLFRVPTGDRHDVKGYGLGLSQVQSIMQAHDGSITVESNKGSGSTFKMNFPYP